MSARASQPAPAPAVSGRLDGRNLGLIVVLAALWGASFLFYKVLATRLPPLTVVLGRVGIAALVLNGWVWWSRSSADRSPRSAPRSPFPPRALWPAYGVLGLLNNVVPFVLFAWGERAITSGLAAILNATTPIFAVLVAHVATRDEKLTRTRLVGVLAGFLGVVVLVGPAALVAAVAGRGGAGGSGGTVVLAELGCLGAALSYALAGVWARRIKGQRPLDLATGQVTASSLTLLPLVLVVDRPWQLAPLDLTGWVALIGLALLCTVIAYALFFRILVVAGATAASLVTFLLPAAALGYGALLLGEAIGWRTLAGMALIALGLAAIDGRWQRLLARRQAA